MWTTRSVGNKLQVRLSDRTRRLVSLGCMLKNYLQYLRWGRATSDERGGGYKYLLSVFWFSFFYNYHLLPFTKTSEFMGHVGFCSSFPETIARKIYVGLRCSPVDYKSLNSA
jgi:hypothetical protein